MSWIVWLFGFFVVLGASQLARLKGYDDNKVSAILLAGLIGAIGYFFMGRAELPDQPFHVRAAEIEARDPTSLGPAETLTRLERLIQTQPDAPEPHFFIGEMMRAQGRDTDAVRAYQSALRRNDRFVPAMVSLGDTLVRLSGGAISEQAESVYARAVALDPSQVRAGFMAGLADWQAGDKATARARWSAVREGVPATDSRQQMLDALIAEAEGVQATEMPEPPDTPAPAAEPDLPK